MIERRAAEIKNLVETDSAADIKALNYEIQGLQEAKANIVEKRDSTSLQGTFNPITGATFNVPVSQTVADGDATSLPEYRSAFYKTLLGHELTEPERAVYKRVAEEKRTDSFSTTGNTAAIIPSWTLNEVISKARTQGGIIGACRSFAVPANVSVPIGTPSGSAGWHTEGGEVAREKPAITNVTFSTHEILKVFSISAKVKRMSIAAFESYLIDELNICVMSTINNSLINGSGSNQGTGILPGVTWNNGNSKTYTTDVSYKDITSMIAMLPRGYSNGAVFAMNNATLYDRIYGVEDNNKRPIFSPDPRNELIGRLLGFPIVVDDYIPDGVILFGNFRYLAYNLPEGIAIERSDQSGFTKGLIDYRALAIADTQVIIQEAFIKLEQAS
ncbi:MAG: phage major capsid protein [Peptococcaceae bacterium]|nr:phage major capsid protein [Peptococcaceae bacterium]